MKREIKFRGKVVHNDPMTNPDDGWVYGFYYQDLDKGEIKHYIKSCPMDWEIIPETVGQFTGLYDKDGTPIYEGDIVKDKFGGIGEIVFIWEEWRVNYGDSDIMSLHDELNDPIVVIGNIHDNPELLNDN